MKQAKQPVLTDALAVLSGARLTSSLHASFVNNAILSYLYNSTDINSQTRFLKQLLKGMQMVAQVSVQSFLSCEVYKVSCLQLSDVCAS